MNLSNLTVVVPTRNEVRNIPAFLNSMPPSLWLIVVDASQDETPDLITTLRPSRTTVIRHPTNITQARQIGAEAAQTPWLLFTDADIIFAPDYFNRLLLYENCDALYGPKLSRDQFVQHYNWMTRGQQLSHKLGIPAVSGSNFLMRRRVFEEIGGFDLRLTCNEDSEIGWRIKRHGYHIEFVSSLVVYACDHRRLYRGTTRKMVHSITRCSLLYLNLIPDRWRSHDWGYGTSRHHV